MNNVKNAAHPLLTAEELGRVIGISGRTVLYWEEKKIITAAIRVGRVVRFELGTVMEQLSAASRRKQAVSQDPLEDLGPGCAKLEPTLLKPQVPQYFESEPPTPAP